MKYYSGEEPQIGDLIQSMASNNAPFGIVKGVHYDYITVCFDQDLWTWNYVYTWRLIRRKNSGYMTWL